jgi:hypothetical protein
MNLATLKREREREFVRNTERILYEGKEYSTTGVTICLDTEHRNDYMNLALCASLIPSQAYPIVLAGYPTGSISLASAQEVLAFQTEMFLWVMQMKGIGTTIIAQLRAATTSQEVYAIYDPRLVEDEGSPN